MLFDAVIAAAQEHQVRGLVVPSWSHRPLAASERPVDEPILRGRRQVHVHLTRSSQIEGVATRIADERLIADQRQRRTIGSRMRMCRMVGGQPVTRRAVYTRDVGVF